MMVCRKKPFALLLRIALCSAMASSAADMATTSSLRGGRATIDNEAKSYSDMNNRTHHQHSRILEEDVHGIYLLVSYVFLTLFS